MKRNFENNQESNKTYIDSQENRDPYLQNKPYEGLDDFSNVENDEEYPKNYAGETQVNKSILGHAKHAVIDTVHKIKDTIGETLLSTTESAKEVLKHKIVEPFVGGDKFNSEKETGGSKFETGKIMDTAINSNIDNEDNKQ